MMIIKIVDCLVEMEPVAKQRARIFTDSKGKIRGGTPSKTKNAQDHIAWLVKQWMSENKKEISKSPLCLNCNFWFHTDDIGMMNKKHTKKPDLDNLVKTVCDALTGIAYEDDKQIVHISASKFYSLGESAVSIMLTEPIL